MVVSFRGKYPHDQERLRHKGKWFSRFETSFWRRKSCLVRSCIGGLFSHERHLRCRYRFPQAECHLRGDDGEISEALSIVPLGGQVNPPNSKEGNLCCCSSRQLEMKCKSSLAGECSEKCVKIVWLRNNYSASKVFSLPFSTFQWPGAKSRWQFLSAEAVEIVVNGPTAPSTGAS